MSEAPLNTRPSRQKLSRLRTVSLEEQWKRKGPALVQCAQIEATWQVSPCIGRGGEREKSRENSSHRAHRVVLIRLRDVSLTVH